MFPKNTDYKGKSVNKGWEIKGKQREDSKPRNTMIQVHSEALAVTLSSHYCSHGGSVNVPGHKLKG